MSGEIVHIELPSRDFERSAAFYAKLFGWRTDGAQSGGHLLFEAPGSVQGSWIREALAQAPGPIPFVTVDDIDATLAAAEAQGGRVLVPRLALGTRGPFGLFADLDGNVIAVLSARGAPATAPAAAPTGQATSVAKPARAGVAAGAGAARAKPAAGADKAAAKPPSKPRPAARKR
jgi:predicted enzyme related to lactoylglutathione lyase